MKGIAALQTIDRNWMTSTGATAGPFAIYDIVGMKMPYNLNLMRAKTDPTAQFITDKIKREMIDQGKIGVSSGEGFYKYLTAAYQNPKIEV